MTPLQTMLMFSIPAVAEAVIIVYVIYAYVWPVISNAGGRMFLEAKKTKKPLVLVDVDNSYYDFDVVVTEGDGWSKTKKGRKIISTPKGIKYAIGGLRLMVAESYTSLAMSVATASMIKEFIKLGLKGEDINLILTAREFGIKPEDVKDARKNKQKILEKVQDQVKELTEGEGDEDAGFKEENTVTADEQT